MIGALSCGMAAVALALAADDHAPQAVDAVAVIDGRPIEREEFARFVLAERATSSTGAEALDQLVQERLVELEARRRGVFVSDAEIAARMVDLDRQMRADSGGKLGLEELLSQRKIDRATFEALLRKSIPAERMMAADFGLPAGSTVPPEKQSLWFKELEAREGVKTSGLSDGVAAEIGEEKIGRTEWAMKLFEGLSPKESDTLFDDFVGIELILAEGKRRHFEVTERHLDAEVAERTAALVAALKAQGMATDGVDYPSTLKSRGEDPDAVIHGDRFRAAILLKELARQRHGADGFRQYYAKHRADFDAAYGRRVRLATIFLVAAQQKTAKVKRNWSEAADELEAIKKRIEQGDVPAAQAFESLAKLKSEHGSAAKGGELGFVAEPALKQRGLPATLLDEKVGALVGPVITADGVWLLRVEEQKAASPFEEIQDEVEKAARRDLLLELRKDKKVERKI